MKIPRHVQAALNQCGRPWRVEKGTRHWKIIVGGHLAGVLSLGSGKREDRRGRRAALNLAANIRKIGNGR